jgi:hypothetical protein
VVFQECYNPPRYGDDLSLCAMQDEGLWQPSPVGGNDENRDPLRVSVNDAKES